MTATGRIAAQHAETEWDNQGVAALFDAIYQRPAWFADAVCRGVGTALFFPVRGETPHAALAMCAVCPVKAECLEFGTSFGSVSRIGGVWGGTTQRRRENRAWTPQEAATRARLKAQERRRNAEAKRGAA